MNHHSPALLSIDASQLVADDIYTPPGWYFDLPMWVQNPAAPGNAAHNYPLALRIHGTLDERTLERSIGEVMRRHQVLRSVFRITADGLGQVVSPALRVAIPVTDLASLRDDEKEEVAHQALLQEACRPFDLACGPMLRASLLRFGAEEHVLLLTTHHAVCDDWSTAVLLRELFALYAAFSTAQRPCLPELTFQYGDYVRWLHARLQGEGLESRVRFWTERLAGENDFHHIGPDHARPQRRSYRGAHERLVLPKEIRSSIEALSRQERITPYMALVTGLQCLLRTYSGQDDIGIGTCVANRPLLELEGLIGPFSNVVLLRTDLSGAPSYREVFRRVREASLAAYSHQDLPFGTLLQHLRPAPASDRNPLFQMLFVLLNAPVSPVAVPGFSVHPFPLDTGTTRYELNLWVKMHDGLELDLQYNTDLFEPATIRNLLKDYRAVLESMAKNPEKPIADSVIPPRTSGDSRRPQLQGPADGSAPRNNMIESHLLALWKEILGKHDVGIHEDFFELGGDSLRAARLFAKIQDTLNVTISLNALFQAPTIAQLARVIAEEKQPHRALEHLVPIQAGKARPPLFCIHGHSGNLLMYRILAQHLGADQPVYGIQPRGLDGKEPPLARIEDMASAYREEVQCVQPDGPYFLTGYCMGGTVAFELAQQLTQHGKTVALLALLDSYNWSKIAPASVSRQLSLKVQDCWLSMNHFLRMGSQQKWKALRRRLREFSGDPVPPQPLAEANSRAAMNYVPRKYSGAILHVRPETMYPRFASPELGWSELAATVEEFIVPGYPWQLFEELQARHIARKLRACIDEYCLSTCLAA